MFGRCQVSIKRAVQRGELPPPVKLLGMPVWTAEKILTYLNKRLDIAQKEEERTRKKIDDLEI
jgi:predicted DNA-binding transcriptional regulator AlpA